MLLPTSPNDVFRGKEFENRIDIRRMEIVQITFRIRIKQRRDDFVSSFNSIIDAKTKIAAGLRDLRVKLAHEIKWSWLITYFLYPILHIIDTVTKLFQVPGAERDNHLQPR